MTIFMQQDDDSQNYINRLVDADVYHHAQPSLGDRDITIISEDGSFIYAEVPSAPWIYPPWEHTYIYKPLEEE